MPVVGALSIRGLAGDFNGANFANSLTGEMALPPDGLHLYVLDVAHFRMVVVNTSSRKMISSVPVGRMPFALGVCRR